MSQFSIQDATPKDVPDMVSCFFAAFKNDILVGNLDKNVDPQVRDKKLGNWMTGLMKEAEQGINGTRFFKAVDEKGNLAGFGKWIFPTTLDKEQQAERDRIDAEAKANPAPELPGTNVSLSKDFFAQLNANRKKYCNPDTDYFMHILAILPQYHRKGLGTMLLTHVLDIIDEQGKRCYIEASAAGLALYKRFGWVEVDEIVVDMAKHGCEGGVITQKCLMREPVRE